MNILVTGGAGYIGSHTCVELIGAGHGVAVLDNTSQALTVLSGERTTVTPVPLNGIGTAFCPYRVQSRQSLDDELKALGYRRRDEWGCPGKALEVPGHPELHVPAYKGFCFEYSPAPQAPAAALCGASESRRARSSASRVTGRTSRSTAPRFTYSMRRS